MRQSAFNVDEPKTGKSGGCYKPETRYLAGTYNVCLLRRQWRRLTTSTILNPRIDRKDDHRPDC